MDATSALLEQFSGFARARLCSNNLAVFAISLFFFFFKDKSIVNFYLFVNLFFEMAENSFPGKIHP